MKRGVFISLCLSILIFGCKKDNNPELPEMPNYNLETGLVTNVTDTSAMVSGTISNLIGSDIDTYGHVWSNQHNPTVNLETKTEFGSLSSDTLFQSQMANLDLTTTYYVRAYSIDSTGTYYGQERSFSTTDNFFRFVVSSHYLYNVPDFAETRGWVIIYSTNGQLLNIQEIFNGNTYDIHWPATISMDKFIVQIFRKSIFFEPYVHVNYFMDSYTHVVPNLWYLGEENPESLERIGRAVVELNDLILSDHSYHCATNKNSFGHENNNYITFNQYFIPDNIYLMYKDEGQIPYYKWFGDIGLNDSIQVDAGDFIQMTDYIDIQFPDFQSGQVMIEAEDDLQTDYNEYYLVDINSIFYQSKIRVYYPGNLFSGYHSKMWCGEVNLFEHMVKKRGTIPFLFVSMPVNININISSITNLDANIVGEFEIDLVSLSWQYFNEHDFFTYWIHGPKSSSILYSAPDLPPEIRALDESLLDLSKLEYWETTFSEYDSFNGYDDYITDRYVQPGSLFYNVIEYYTKEIYGEGKNPTNMKSNSIEIDGLKLEPLGR